jgi:tetratricopeptide (TPR) repeat protein
MMLEDDAAPMDTRMKVEDEEPTGDEDADFQSMLQAFKKGIAANVGEEDFQSHYDLGVAYKEMGLLDEAIGEFELAHRHGGGTRAADCVAMLGMCEMERGQTAAAIKRFLEGLALKGLTPAARHALKFELGAAYEAQQQTAEAVDQYQSIAEEDPKFRDVADRIQRLGGTVVATGRPIVKQGSGMTKAAAQVSSAVSAAAKSKPAAARSDAEPSEPARKNRKIGFV